MTLLDEFESRFKRAAKAKFQYEQITIEKVLFVTDHDEEEASRLEGLFRRFLRVMDIKGGGSPECERTSLT